MVKHNVYLHENAIHPLKHRPTQFPVVFFATKKAPVVFHVVATHSIKTMFPYGFPPHPGYPMMPMPPNMGIPPPGYPRPPMPGQHHVESLQFPDVLCGAFALRPVFTLLPSLAYDGVYFI
jgi:hypothetical protein